MVFIPTSAQPFTSPGKRKRNNDDLALYSPDQSPVKLRNAGTLQTDPPLVAQQACDGTSTSQMSMTGKFQNLAIKGSTTQEKPLPISHHRERPVATGVDSSPAECATFSTSSEMSSVLCTPEIKPPSVSNFKFESPWMIGTESTREQCRSPPLCTGKPLDKFWHESEITGHNPVDPEDDGEGIDGIGFKPTPAIAWARSQKRKQQLADYNTRETNEARQRRIERRREPSSAASEKENENTRSTKMRVRFEDG